MAPPSTLQGVQLVHDRFASGARKGQCKLKCTACKADSVAAAPKHPASNFVFGLDTTPIEAEAEVGPEAKAEAEAPEVAALSHGAAAVHDRFMSGAKAGQCKLKCQACSDHAIAGAAAAISAREGRGGVPAVAVVITATPDADSSKSELRAELGQFVAVLTRPNENWCWVQIGNGAKGYIRSDFIQVQVPTVLPMSKTTGTKRRAAGAPSSEVDSKPVPSLRQAMVAAPNAPKRPRSAYVLFSSSIREAVTKEVYADGKRGESAPVASLAAAAAAALVPPVVTGVEEAATNAPPLVAAGPQAGSQAAADLEQSAATSTPSSAAGPRAVMKELASRWSSLPAEEKAVWEGQAKTDKDRYNAELEGFDGPLQVAKPGSRSKKKKRKSKPVDQPKRFASAFLHFSSVRRPQVKAQFPHLQHIEVTKQLGTEWNGMLDEAKEPYKEIERKERAEWEAAMLQYKLKQQGTGSESAEATAEGAERQGLHAAAEPDVAVEVGTDAEAIGVLVPPKANDGMGGDFEESEQESEEEQPQQKEEEKEPGGLLEKDELDDAQSTKGDQGIGMGMEVDYDQEGGASSQ